MSWKSDSSLRHTAAWRFSALATAAFALGTGAAFLVAYVIVARGIRERTDAWLRGETELLAEVVANTRSGLEERLVEEVAELATHEVTPMIGEDGVTEQPVFFLVTSRDGRPDIWVGPKDRDLFISILRKKRFEPGLPRSVDVTGWPHSFRVNAHRDPNGASVYLGLLDHSALTLLNGIRTTFTELWMGMLALGFAISYVGSRRILGRVERITEAAVKIGAGDLGRRVPVGQGRDEIARLSSTFNGMLDRIEASVTQIRALSDAVAHDLRSPVTTIRGNLEMALGSGDAERLREAVNLSLERIDHLLKTLNTTLDVAEAEAGALLVRRRAVDLLDVAEEMVEIYRPAAEERGISVESREGGKGSAHLDVSLVQRALANLLDNALQHLPAGRHVTVKVEEEAASVRLIVEDDGPGFPPDLRERAFERFAKGPGSRGSGLGLALVRAVAIAHGGEARILDAPGGGAQVRITFPRESAEPHDQNRERQ